MVQTAPGAGQCGPPYGVKWNKGLNVLTDTKQTIQNEQTVLKRQKDRSHSEGLKFLVINEQIWMTETRD